MTERCKEVLNELTTNYRLMSLVSDAVYNEDRYAYNSTIILIEHRPPYKETCGEIEKYIRQTDKFLKVSNRFCVIEYPFVDYLNACQAFENLKREVLTGNIDYKYTIVSVADNSDLNVAEILKKLSHDICANNDFITKD